MSERNEYRYHRLAGQYVVVAPTRAPVLEGVDRLSGLPELQAACPFCPSNEASTEGTVAVVPEEGPWRVRVVRNKYPVVVERLRLDEASATSPSPGVGCHELVIESPDHDADLAHYDPAHAASFLRVVRDRAAAIAAAPDIEWLTIFRNKGRKSGSSQPHPHTQLVGTAMPMPDPAVRWQHALEHHARTGRNLLSDLLAGELADPARTVLENEHFRLVVPYAPLRTFEAWVVPRAARGCFSHASDEAIAALAALLPGAVDRVLRGSRRSDYNVVFRLPPVSAREHPAAFHVIEIVPRGSVFAGLELATGTGVVAVTPERAAALYRDVGPAH